MTRLSKSVYAVMPSRPKRTEIILMITPAGSPSEGNEQGRFADILTRIAGQILKSAGSDWRDAHAFGGEWYVSSPATHLARRARSLIDKIPASWDSLTLDHPAIARTLPFWFRQFDEAGLPLRLTFAIGGSVNDTPARLAASWMRTLLEAERLSRGRTREIVPSVATIGAAQIPLVENSDDAHVAAWVRSKMPVLLTHLRQAIGTGETDQGIRLLARMDLALSDLCLSQESVYQGGSMDVDHALVIARLDELDRRVAKDKADVDRIAATLRSLQTNVSAQFAAITGAYKGHVDALQSQLAAQAIAAKQDVVADEALDPPADVSQPMESLLDPLPDEQVDISETFPPFDPLTDIIRNAALFDASYYLAHNPDVREAGLDPAHHYLLFGGMEGRDPGPGFWSAAYLTAYPDVAAADVNPLLHFIQFGEQEGRDPRPLSDADAALVAAMRDSELFDAIAYAKQVGLDPGGDAARHYYDNQRNGAVDPSADFWAAAYLAAYPDVAEAGINPLGHYLLFGANEGRDPRPLPPAEAAMVEAIRNHPIFDAAWYRDTHHIDGQQDAARHFYDRWNDKSIDPGPGFKSAWYLRANTDVAATGMPAFLHYIQYGQAEGRLPAPREPEFSALISASPQYWATLRLRGESPPVARIDATNLEDIPLSCLIDTEQVEQFLSLSGAVYDIGAELSSSSDRATEGDPAFPAIVDAWFSDHGTIRLRFDIWHSSDHSQSSRTLTAYQVVAGQIMVCGTIPLEGGDIVPIRLINPLTPVLLAVRDICEPLARARLIPFPSLYRGGLHASEAAIAANDTGLDVGSLSEKLLKQALDVTRPLVIGKLLVDARQALQTEPIHNSWVREWLEDVMRIQIEHVDEADRVPMPASGIGISPRPGRQKDGHPLNRDIDGHVLTLPNSHCPTIAGLLHRSSGGETMDGVCDFLFADALSNSIIAAVRLPEGALVHPGIAHCEDTTDAMPTLAGTVEDHQGEPDGKPDIYLSIGFGRAARDEASLLLRSAPDLPRAILPRAGSSIGGIAVIVRHAGNADHLKSCLLSLSLQTRSDALSVNIVSDALSDASLPFTDLDRDLFGSRIAFRTTGDAFVPMQGEGGDDWAALVIDDSVILHDHRIIETLETLADQPSVASMSCLLVGEAGKADPIPVLSSGCFYDPVTEQVVIRDMFDPLPYTVYPVAFCHARLALVPSHARPLLGNPAMEGTMAWGDFMEKSYAAGLVHMATSMVSATIRTSLSEAEEAMPVPPAIPVQALPQVTVFRA